MSFDTLTDTSEHLHHQTSDQEGLCREIIEGLQSHPKQLPCKLFYDKRGSEIFEQICKLPEYYPTRTELSILKQHMGSIAEACGPNCRVVEFGCGSGEKTVVLARNLIDPVDLVLIDISHSAVSGAAENFSQELPALPVVPVTGDYTIPLQIPSSERPSQRTLVYFPGSTIGNFVWDDAVAFLKRCRDLAGPNGAILLGTDLHKDQRVLEAAYNDSAGVTAAFNLNMLEHCNRITGADFQTNDFRHKAVYDPQQRRIEMRLISSVGQTVTIGSDSFEFARDEWIRTEYSHKYRMEDIDHLAAAAGFIRSQSWTDDKGWFAVSLFEAR